MTDTPQTTIDGQAYEHAMRLLKPHISRDDKGKFIWGQAADALGLDPAILSDLKRSLELTNQKIDDGEIDPTEIADD